MSKSKSYEIDMCNGPLLSKIIIFAIPLMLSGILQLLFNAADIVVVGQFAGNDALAAVGATSSLINLLVNLFIGLSVGANVLVARYFGAGQKRELSDMVHTAITTSLVSGFILIFIGLFLSGPLLSLMGTPKSCLEQATLYMQIYFAGMPVIMAYNFGSAILRAVGDTKRPLYFLILAGVINVLLNLFFVIVLKMGVSGVALATVISQIVSAALVIKCLVETDSEYKLNIKELRIVPDKLLKMMKIGLPAGLQGMLFSISNVLIQSSVNSFGSIAMAGNTAASNIEGFVYMSMNALHQTAISFTGQNFGAKKFARIKKILLECLLIVFIIGFVFGNIAYLTSSSLLNLYSSDAAVIQYGVKRLAIICTTYFLCGMMEVVVGVLRGMGYSIMPMLVSLSGACVFRIIWIYTVFVSIRTLDCLYWSYPISWFLTFSVHLLCFIIVFRKNIKKNALNN